MQTGDPKKAAVLLVVAIMVIGVAVFRSIPHSPSAPPMSETPRAEGVAATDSVKQKAEELPTTLTSEPFAKPAPKSLGAAMPAVSQPAPNHRPITGAHVAPLVPSGISGALPSVSSSGAAPVNPSENTGSSRNSNQDTPTTATFDGVVEVTRRIAIITVSNKIDKTFQCAVGSFVAGYEVTEITDSKLTLKKGKKVVVLAAGKSASL